MDPANSEKRRISKFVEFIYRNGNNEINVFMSPNMAGVELDLTNPFDREWVVDTQI